jgi:small subunit ribosomal protein S3
MKGEVYGKRELSPLVGLSKKQSGKSSARGGNKSRRRK